MKYATTAHAILFATIASSIIGTGSAVPRPGPAAKVLQPSTKTRNGSEGAAAASSPSTGLLVDREGNLYSPRTTKTNTLQKGVIGIGVRGGALCVDNEGNFYAVAPPPPPTNTLLRDETSSSSRTKTTFPPAPSSPSSILRGGSNNHNIGGLGVDTEGNLFAIQGRAAAAAVSPSSAALLLRGGDLSVDNEGNFYTPRFTTTTTTTTEKQKPTTTPSLQFPSNRRSSGAHHDAVLLTKNRLPKKTNGSDNGSGSRIKTTKKPSSGDDAMAFIGYNNALMET